MTGDTDGAASALDDDLRADALDVLRDVPAWRLAAPRWGAVDAAVSALAAAVRAGDRTAAAAAVAELELLGPVRATLVGSAATEPAPEHVREEINQLVRTLDSSTASQ